MGYPVPETLIAGLNPCLRFELADSEGREGYEDSVPARQMPANPVRSGRKQR